jgi:hypothetical protein
MCPNIYKSNQSLLGVRIRNGVQALYKGWLFVGVINQRVARQLITLSQCRVIRHEPGHIRTKVYFWDPHIIQNSSPHQIIFFISKTENQLIPIELNKVRGWIMSSPRNLKKSYYYIRGPVGPTYPAMGFIRKSWDFVLLLLSSTWS